MWAQQYTTPSHAAIIFTLEPVFAVITSYLVIGERLNGRSMVGAVFGVGWDIDCGIVGAGGGAGVAGAMGELQIEGSEVLISEELALDGDNSMNDIAELRFCEIQLCACHVLISFHVTRPTFHKPQGWGTLRACLIS